MQMSTGEALGFMRGGNARGHGLGDLIPYHDPTYDPAGGQGTAVYASDPNAQPQNPGILLLIVGIIALILLMGEE